MALLTVSNARLLNFQAFSGAEHASRPIYQSNNNLTAANATATSFHIMVHQETLLLIFSEVH